MENFTELEKLHDDVIQELTTAKQVFELRLTETDAQLRSFDVEHQRSLATVESRYRHEMDVLTGNLEDREHDVEELRQELEDIVGGAYSYGRETSGGVEILRSPSYSHGRPGGGPSPSRPFIVSGLENSCYQDDLTTGNAAQPGDTDGTERTTIIVAAVRCSIARRLLSELGLQFSEPPPQFMILTNGETLEGQ